MFDFTLYTDELISTSVSLLCGTLIGLEREYKNKSAGLRTIILICLGSTIFTLVSRHFQNGTNDRIASNIVTGIGFIGAGVIFKDTIWVKGLTTAAVIWISAAIGMMAGTHYYFFAFLLSVLTIFILSGFPLLEAVVDRANHRLELSVTFNGKDLELLHDFERNISDRALKYKRKVIYKTENELVALVDIIGPRQKISLLNEEMVKMPSIKSFYAM